MEEISEYLKVLCVMPALGKRKNAGMLFLYILEE
jgi:hypothetical protein